MYKRRIPTDKQWFDYKNNKHAGWLFCFMSSSASYHDKLYYPKQRFLDDLPLIKKFLGVNDKRTINRYLNILKNNNYISEDDKNYYFPYVIGQGTYILLDRDLLYNLCITKSTLLIQIFCYLYMRMSMKESLSGESEYNFTLKEIRVALGYSSKSQNATIEKAIKECLETMKAGDYIDYENIYVDIMVNGVPEKVPNFKLTKIIEELPQKIQEIKSAEKNTFIF